MVDLKTALVWLAGGPGCGIAAWWIMNKIKWAASVGSEAKRLISIAMSIVIAEAAWLFLIFAAQAQKPKPEDGWWGWAVQIFAIAGLAYISNQTAHGVKNLRDEDKRIGKVLW